MSRGRDPRAGRLDSERRRNLGGAHARGVGSRADGDRGVRAVWSCDRGAGAHGRGVRRPSRVAGNRRWMAHEDASLRAGVLARRSHAEIARSLGRSEQAIRVRAQRIGAVWRVCRTWTPAEGCRRMGAGIDTGDRRAHRALSAGGLDPSVSAPRRRRLRGVVRGRPSGRRRLGARPRTTNSRLRPAHVAGAGRGLIGLAAAGAAPSATPLWKGGLAPVVWMVCSEPGCTTLVRRGYCARHQRRRASASRRGYGRRWQARRRAWLAEHPWCARCEREGRVVAAVDVHHVERHRGDAVAVLQGGLESLCKRCHGLATAAGE